LQHEFVASTRHVHPILSRSRETHLSVRHTAQAMHSFKPIARCVWLGWRSVAARPLAIRPYATSELQTQHKVQLGKPHGHKFKQTLDYTTLVACCNELKDAWAPSKIEEVSQIAHVGSFILPLCIIKWNLKLNLE
jgi:hypothetical protein